MRPMYLILKTEDYGFYFPYIIELISFLDINNYLHYIENMYAVDEEISIYFRFNNHRDLVLYVRKKNNGILFVENNLGEHFLRLEKVFEFIQYMVKGL